MSQAYQPSSRRPIAAGLRRTADGCVALCVRYGIHPDAISYASIAASAGAAVCFWQSGKLVWLLIPAAVLCYVRLWFNMLDGMVALASGKASRRGEILNELPDRLSDTLIFVGVGYSGLCHPASGWAVAVMALAVAYVGTFGQALGAQREFGGTMSKPWRMVALHLGAWVTLGMHIAGQPIWYAGLTIIDWTLVLILIGGVQTIAIRLRRIIAALD